MIDFIRSLFAQSIIILVEFIILISIVLWYFSTDIWDRIYNSLNVLEIDTRGFILIVFNISIISTVCNLITTLVYGFNSSSFFSTLSSFILFGAGVYFIIILLVLNRIKIKNTRRKYKKIY